MVCVGNPDEIFELKTPAGICSVIKETDNMHGKKIPKYVVRKSLTDYGIRGPFPFTFLPFLLCQRQAGRPHDVDNSRGLCLEVLLFPFSDLPFSLCVLQAAFSF